MKTCRIAGFLLIAVASAASAQDCDMTHVATHGDPARTRILSSETGVPALYFRADMDVNTDGAARSYHPDDPRGQTRALNNIANAISRIFDAAGRDITCSPRQGSCFTRFIETFEAARDSNYATEGAPRVETRHMIPWRMDSALGREVPCRIESGPNAGYFVSQTSVEVDSALDVCDQARYLDSLAIKANVLPGNISWRSQGVITDRTDLVVARDRKTGVVAFGINGDRGPPGKIGEGSVAFAAALAGVTLTGDETYGEIKGLAREEVDYLIFPTHDIRKIVGKGFTQADIDREGARVFEAWGGAARLDNCAGE